MFELNKDTKVKDMFDQCRQAGAGSMKVILRNDKDEPTCAFIAIVGVRDRPRQKIQGLPGDHG
jgi:hypothetical protein